MQQFRCLCPGSVMATPPPPVIVNLANQRWDEVNATTRGGASTWSLAQLGPLRSLCSSAPLAVVSFGCGPTLLEDETTLRGFGMRFGEGSTLLGIDVLPYHFENLPNGVDFCVGLAAATGLLSASTDIVYVSSALFHHGELAPTAAEIARVLRPRGVVFLVQTFELALVDALMHELVQLGFGLEQRLTSVTRRSVLLRQHAPHAIAVPPLTPLAPRYRTDADYTIVYWIWTPSGRVYVGSTCENGMLWATIGPVTFWTKHRWAAHRNQLLAGKHPSLQREWVATREEFPGWEPIDQTATEAAATCTVSADGLTHTYVVRSTTQHYVVIEATRLAPDETIEVAKVAMVAREQVGIFESKHEGTLLNASDLAAAPDSDACSRGGRGGAAVERCERRVALAAQETRTAEEVVQLAGLEATRDADERAYAVRQLSAGCQAPDIASARTADALAGAPPTLGVVPAAPINLSAALDARKEVARQRAMGHGIDLAQLPRVGTNGGPFGGAVYQLKINKKTRNFYTEEEAKLERELAKRERELAKREQQELAKRERELAKRERELAKREQQELAKRERELAKRAKKVAKAQCD